MDNTPHTTPVRSAQTRLKITFLLPTVSLLVLASWACGWFPFDWSQWDFGKTPEQATAGEENGQDQWDVNRCSAVGEVKIDLSEFSEETFKNSDGSPGGTECAYTYQVTNTSDQSLILAYFDHFYYGDNPPPNEYEFGWQKTAPIQPGGSWSLDSFASSYPKQPLYLDQIHSLAVIYDTPGCAWLTGDGIRQEILEIAAQEPLQAPCKLIAPWSSPETDPDLSQGLLVDQGTQ